MGYGIIGFAVLVLFLPEVLRYPLVAKMFGVAFIFFVTHTWIDMAFSPATFVSIAWAESAKTLMFKYVGHHHVFGEHWNQLSSNCQRKSAS